MEASAKFTPSNWKPQLDQIIATNGQRNNFCADCNINSSDSNWSVWNHGVFVCIKCAGIHRQIGVHISKVKSTEFDKWNNYELKQVRSIGGNENVNKKLEHRKPKYFINPSECDGVEGIRTYYIRQKYECKLFETDNKDDVAIHEMPQKLVIGTFLYENNKKRVYLQLLGRTLYHFKNNHDSYDLEHVDVTEISVTISYSYSDYTNFVLNIYRESADDSLFRIRGDGTQNILYLIDWVHSIRRSQQYYIYLDSIEQKNENEHQPQPQPLNEISAKELEEATVLGIASKKGGGTRSWRKRWWVLHSQYLYYFKSDFRTNKKAKGTGIPQGHISLFGADIIWDYDRTRTGKRHALLVVTPNRTFYVQPQQQNKDMLFHTINACCRKYINAKPFDFVKNMYL